MNRAIAVAAALALAGCLPDPRGRCQGDGDCGDPAAGMFCAEGVCQAPPRVAFAEVPRAVLGRDQTAIVRVRVDRSHGGASGATASLRINGNTVEGVRDPDGGIRFDVPLTLAPPGVEAAIPIEVSVRDDLGHTTLLGESLQLDDLAPRVIIDADSVPTNAVLRGTVVQMRAHVSDHSPVTLTPSQGMTATLQLDGSFRLALDTNALDPGTETAQPTLTAADIAGNHAAGSAQFPVTRVRWQVTPNGVPSVGIALTAVSVVVTTKGANQVMLNRSTGSIQHTAMLATAALGNLATNGSEFFTARTDGFISSFDSNGIVRWNCDQFGTIKAGPALGMFDIGGTPVLGAILLGAGTLTIFDQRLYTLRDDLALQHNGLPGSGNNCTSGNSARASNQLTGVVFDRGAASIGLDDNVYAGAQQALVRAQFDGLAWTVQPVTTLAIAVVGQPALVRSATGAQIAFVSGNDGSVDGIAYPGGRLAGFPVLASNSSPVTATPPTIAEDGTVTVGTGDGNVASILPDGTLIRRKIGDQVTTSPTHGTGGIVYVGTNTGITAMRLQDGAVLWTFATRAPVNTPPALGCNGVLYFGDDSGTITALQTDSAGLADTPWPRGGHDVHGTGNAHHAVRALDGSCVE